MKIFPILRRIFSIFVALNLIFSSFYPAAVIYAQDEEYVSDEDNNGESSEESSEPEEETTNRCGEFKFVYNECVVCNASRPVEQNSCGEFQTGSEQEDSDCASWCELEETEDYEQYEENSQEFETEEPEEEQEEEKNDEEVDESSEEEAEVENQEDDIVQESSGVESGSETEEQSEILTDQNSQEEVLDEYASNGQASNAYAEEELLDERSEEDLGAKIAGMPEDIFNAAESSIDNLDKFAQDSFENIAEGVDTISFDHPQLITSLEEGEAQEKQSLLEVQIEKASPDLDSDTIYESLLVDVPQKLKGSGIEFQNGDTSDSLAFSTTDCTHDEQTNVCLPDTSGEAITEQGLVNLNNLYQTAIDFFTPWLASLGQRNIEHTQKVQELADLLKNSGILERRTIRIEGSEACIDDPLSIECSLALRKFNIQKTISDDLLNVNDNELTKEQLLARQKLIELLPQINEEESALWLEDAAFAAMLLYGGRAAAVDAVNPFADARDLLKLGKGGIDQLRQIAQRVYDNLPGLLGRTEVSQYGKLIGMGASGDVYVDKEQKVATKIFRYTGRGVAINSLTEVKVLQQADGRGSLPKLQEILYDENGAIIGFKAEYIKGPTFAEFVKSGGKISLEEARRFLNDLEELHGITGLPHNDLHVNNILVETIQNSDGSIGHRLRMIDYGSGSSSIDASDLQNVLNSDVLSALSLIGRNYRSPNPGKIIKASQEEIDALLREFIRKYYPPERVEDIINENRDSFGGLVSDEPTIIEKIKSKLGDIFVPRREFSTQPVFVNPVQSGPKEPPLLVYLNPGDAPKPIIEHPVELVLRASKIVDEQMPQNDEQLYRLSTAIVSEWLGKGVAETEIQEKLKFVDKYLKGTLSQGELDYLQSVLRYDARIGYNIEGAAPPENFGRLIALDALLTKAENAKKLEPFIADTRNMIKALDQYAAKNGVDTGSFVTVDTLVDPDVIHVVSPQTLQSLFPGGGEKLAVHVTENNQLWIRSDILEKAIPTTSTVCHECLHRSTFFKRDISLARELHDQLGKDNSDKLIEGLTDWVTLKALALTREPLPSGAVPIYEGELEYLYQMGAVNTLYFIIERNTGFSSGKVDAVLIDAVRSGNFDDLYRYVGAGDRNSGIQRVKEILDKTPSVYNQSSVTNPEFNSAVNRARDVIKPVKSDEPSLQGWLPFIKSARAGIARYNPSSFIKIDAFSELVKEKLIEQRLLDFGAVSQQFVRNVMDDFVIQPSFYQTLDGYTFTTGVGGIASGEVETGKYIVDIIGIPDLDITVPANIEIGDRKEIIIPVGVHLGKGNIIKKQTGSLQQNRQQQTKINASVIIFEDSDKDGRFDQDEIVLPWAGVDVQLRKAQQTKPIVLKNGWNLITLPVLPARLITSSKLLEKIAKDGGYATTVATLEHGLWKSYVIRGGNIFSNNDFAIEPGKAYFVKSVKDSVVLVEGNTFAGPLKTELKDGWNAVGFPVLNKMTTAGDIIRTISGTDAIAQWESGLWDTVVIKDKKIFGRDFNVGSGRGYIIRAGRSLKF